MRIVIDTQKFDNVTIGQIKDKLFKNKVVTAPSKMLKASKGWYGRRQFKKSTKASRKQVACIIVT